MAEQGGKGNEGGNKNVLSLSGHNTLKLDTKGEMVRQSFSHGRSKAVAVEVRKKRVGSPHDITPTAPRSPVSHAPGVPTREALKESAAKGAARRSAAGGSAGYLTDQEREARARALKALQADAKARGDQREHQPSIAELNKRPEPVAAPVAQDGGSAGGIAASEVSGLSGLPAGGVSAAVASAAVSAPVPAKPLDREALRRQEMEEMRRIKEQERQAATQAELKRQQEENARRRAEAEKRNGGASGVAGGASPAAREGADDANSNTAGYMRYAPSVPASSPRDDDDGGRGGAARRGRSAGRAGAPRTGGGGGDRWNRQTVVASLDGEETVRRRSVASMRRRAERARQMQQQEAKEKIFREIVLPEVITVQELAARMAERGADVVKSLMKMGMMVTITQTIDADTAELVANEMGHRVKRVTEADVLEGLGGEDDTPEAMLTRPPVVTIMGHVDHGKTSLLDAIRKTNVVSGEAGGITQHIGAYQIQLPNRDEKITFIDTPGHAAFSEMRARGANVTDVVVLVVAADDGLMPQTIEAISHAKAAGVPIVVAINKCDLPAANPQRVRTDLLQYELITEDMGGDVLDVEVSAKMGTNLDKLLEAILLQAEVLDLKANPSRPAQGTVVESRLERGRGSVATVLVQKGTLKQGDIFVSGAEWGRVRALLNDRGETIREAGPAVPVEVLGLQGTPQAGDDFVVVGNEARAREVADYRARKRREAASAASARGSLDQMFAQIKAGEVKELPVVIKGDVHGSVEAIATALEKLTTENTEVKVRVLHTAVGAITESDVILSNAAGKALIIGFNVRANPQAREMARRDGIEIRYYSIIYQVIDDIKSALSGMLAPTLREKFIGYAAIRQVFNITGVGKVAGCLVTEGLVKRGAGVRLLRDNVVIHTGTLKTLKRFKDEVKEAKEGYECGMAFEKYDDIKEGDVIEAFEIEEIARALE